MRVGPVGAHHKSGANPAAPSYGQPDDRPAPDALAAVEDPAAGGSSRDLAAGPSLDLHCVIQLLMGESIRIPGVSGDGRLQPSFHPARFRPPSPPVAGHPGDPDALLYQARWSAHVHEEWIRAVLRDNAHLTRGRLRAVQEGMDVHAADALVTGYEPLIDGLVLPDPSDRHVLAAAIVTGADVIVTRNLRHFPAAALDPQYRGAIPGRIHPPSARSCPGCRGRCGTSAASPAEKSAGADARAPRFARAARIGRDSSRTASPAL